MKKLSFIIAIIGILFLLFYVSSAKPIKVDSPENLSSLEENQKVIVSGKIIKSSKFGSSLLLKLDSELELLCSCSFDQKYENKNISALGYKDSFSGISRIQVLKIKFNS